jgi:ferrochelatase
MATPSGLLLINLGTPDAPTATAVRRYLAEFLSDPYVLDMSPVGRWLLLHAIILRTRPAKSAHAYQQVWDAQRGSPLLYHSRDLRDGVAAALGDGWQVELAMRYQSPSIADALARLHGAGVRRVVVLPLFPQYALSSTGTALARVRELAMALPSPLELVEVTSFHGDGGFLDAFAARGREAIAARRPDHVVFSFHGLPERHVRLTDRTGAHCLASAGCCDADTPASADCYRAHCFQTARALAARLELAPGSWDIAFQSRLGRTPWIQPYTDELVPRLAAAGKRDLLVFCPAFVADCLETLEEIGMRAREQFRAAGGDDLRLVPSLNATAPWVAAVATLARRHAHPGLAERASARG